MPDDTKLYNFRLPIALMERVKAMAGKHKLNVTEVVLTKLRTFADEGVQSNLVPSFDGDAKAKDAELIDLKRQLAAAKAKAPQMIQAERQLAAFQTEVATLKRELAKRPLTAAMRRDPAMRDDAIPDGKSLLPPTLPVMTDFPARQVHQRGQSPGKGKRCS